MIDDAPIQTTAPKSRSDGCAVSRNCSAVWAEPLTVASSIVHAPPQGCTLEIELPLYSPCSCRPMGRAYEHAWRTHGERMAGKCAVSIQLTMMYCSASRVIALMTVHVPCIYTTMQIQTSAERTRRQNAECVIQSECSWRTSSTRVPHGEACTCRDTRKDFPCGSVTEPPTTFSPANPSNPVRIPLGTM